MREILPSINDFLKKSQAVVGVCQIVSHQLAILKLWNDNNFHTHKTELKTRRSGYRLVASKRAVTPGKRVIMLGGRYKSLLGNGQRA